MKILYFAPIDWEHIRQRPQHLAQRLSHYFPFFYLQPVGLRNLRLKDLKRIIKRFFGLFKTSTVHPSLKIKNLVYFPFFNKYVHWMNVFMLRRQIKSLTDGNTIVWITTPAEMIPDILDSLPYKALIYEMMDDYPKIHPHNEKRIHETEAWFLNEADLMIVTSEALLEKARKRNKEKGILLVSNGVDYEFFNQKSLDKPHDIQGMDRIVGYVGSIDTWIDMETIAFLADERTDLDFVFVGPIKLKKMPQRKNLHFLGKRDYAMMPNYCNAFHVCLIPFKSGEFADTINPVKLFEYFALGKPVVASEMRELMQFDSLIYTAKDRQEFLEKLGIAFEENDIDKVTRRKELARQNDWSEKAKLLRNALLTL